MTAFIEQFGWFRFRYHSDFAELLSITNELTGQSLTVQSVVGISLLDDDKQYTAVYRDKDIAQTVTFSVCRNQPFAGQLSDYFSISLDYENVYSDIPLYGHWRRVDDFITDALLCWRPQRIGSVTVTGGWVGGQWCNKTQRQYNIINGLPWEENNHIAEPYVYPLDGTASQSWQLYDSDNKPEIEYNLAYQFYPNTQIPYIPIDKTPQDFVGRVPYLQRADTKGYFIFSDTHTYTPPHSDFQRTNNYYIYLDEDVFFTFCSYQTWDNDFGGKISHYGFRHYPFKPVLWAMKYQNDNLITADPARHSEFDNNKSYLYPYLSYVVWLRVKHAFCDAWQMWEQPLCASGEKNTADAQVKNKTTYGGKATIANGFVAGISVSLSISIEYTENEKINTKTVSYW